jgi:Flp pilus assembly protein TadB
MSDPENPVLKLDAKGLLDFVDSQNKKEREYFDRLLRWFAAGIAVVIAGFAVLGVQNWNQVRKISEDIRAETTKQLSAAVSDELTKAKIQDQIGKTLQRMTEDQFRGSRRCRRWPRC